MRTYLPVGDPRREAVGRAAGAVLVAAFVFMAFQLPVKRFLGLSDELPWSDDPYDAATSFALLFVPLIAAVCLVRLALCRRDQPLPLDRVIGVLRGCLVVLGAMIVTLVSDWISVALQANRSAWVAGTGILIGAAVVQSLLVTIACVSLLRASRLVPRVTGDQRPVTDGLSDLLVLAERCTRWFGPLARFAHAGIAWLDRAVARTIRRLPIVAAAAAALAFGVILALNTLLREGGGPALWIDVVVGSSGMFAFLVAAGSYLGLVRIDRPVAGIRRRAVDAAVFGCFAVPIALAFRESLWWIVGSDSGSPGRLGALLAAAAVSIAAVVFAGETALRVHQHTNRATDRG
jgi:hypothetical protein